MNTQDIQRLVRTREQELIEKRTKIEIEVNTFMESLKNIAAEIADLPDKPAGETAKEILPSLWAEPFVKDTYLTELEQFNKYKDNVLRFADSVNERAMKCLTT